MNCDQSTERIYYYMDGQLTWWRRLQIRRHMKSCFPCAQSLDFEIRVRRVISLKCHDEAPEELKRRVMEALQRQHPEQPSE